MGLVGDSASHSNSCTLSLHDALPIYPLHPLHVAALGPKTANADAFLDALEGADTAIRARPRMHPHSDRKSTRLNSSHTVISYAVFCLKKKTTSHPPLPRPHPPHPPPP